MKAFVMMVWAAINPLLLDNPPPQSPAINFPHSDAAPTPAPPPPPNPAAPIKLPADCFYVITSDVAFITVASPDGIVKITSESGPVKIRGKFTDNPDRVQTKSFPQKYVMCIEAAGDGSIELLTWSTGITSGDAVIRHRLDVGAPVVVPPVVPPVNPPTPPQPPVTPAPIPVDGFRVLIRYDDKTLATLPQAQADILTSTDVRAWLDAHCVKGPDGKTPEWRIWKSSLNPKGAAQLWQDAWARPHASDFWIIISDGKTGIEQKLPASIEDTLTLLKKYGGN